MLISTTLFCEKHNITKENLYSTCRHLYVKIDNKNYIDEDFFIKRQEFRKKVWLQSHDYYYMLSYFLRDYTMAKILSRYTGIKQTSWSSFLNKDLFSLAWLDGSILNYKIPMKQWAFFRVTSFLVKGLIRKESE